MFLGMCPPTPPLSQHFALSEKQVLMLAYRRGRWFGFRLHLHVPFSANLGYNGMFSLADIIHKQNLSLVELCFCCSYYVSTQ